MTSSKRTRGRPTILTPQLIRTLEKGAEAGLTRAEMAEYAGVAARSVQRWLTLGTKVNERGHHTSDFERLCGILRTRITAADTRRRGTPPDSVREQETEPADPVEPVGYDIEKARVFPMRTGGPGSVLPLAPGQQGAALLSREPLTFITESRPSLAARFRSLLAWPIRLLRP
jgi:hypothetical protein